VDPVQHEEENKDDQPQIGHASLIVSASLLLAYLDEGVDEDDSQNIGDEAWRKRVEEGCVYAYGCGPGYDCDVIRSLGYRRSRRSAAVQKLRATKAVYSSSQ